MKTTLDHIKFLQQVLNCTDIQLAGYVGISLRTLNEWLPISPLDYTGKQIRLSSLSKIAKYLLDTYPHYDIRNILVNGRVKIAEPDGDDDGTISLLSYILACPEDVAWRSAADEATNEYLAYMSTFNPYL